jgi:hypothetical protein
MAALGGRVVLATKIALGLAAAALIVFSVIPHLVGANKPGPRDAGMRWPHEAVPAFSAQPTQRLLFKIGDDPSIDYWVSGANAQVESVGSAATTGVVYGLRSSKVHLYDSTFRGRLAYDGPPLLRDVIVLAIVVFAWRAVGAPGLTSQRLRRCLAVIGLLIGVGLTAAEILADAGRIDLLRRSVAAHDLFVLLDFPLAPLLVGLVLLTFASILRQESNVRRLEFAAS